MKSDTRKKIKKTRNELGLTQEQLATKCNVKRSTIQALETRSDYQGSVTLLRQVAKVLKLDPVIFLN